MTARERAQCTGRTPRALRHDSIASSVVIGMRFDLMKAIAGHLTGEAFGAHDTSAGEHPTRAEIARLAYEFYERRGGRDGDAVDDWLRAESELRRHFD